MPGGYEGTLGGRPSATQITRSGAGNDATMVAPVAVQADHEPGGGTRVTARLPLQLS